MKKLLIGALLGGLVAFIWSSISWMVLPWHGNQMRKFTDEAAVAAVLKANAPETGVYVLPKGERMDEMDECLKKMAAGPYAFGVVRPGSATVSMPANMIAQFLIQCVGAFLMTALLLTARPLSFGGRVLLVVIVAVTGGVLCHLPAWNWWEMPAGWVLVDMLDLAIGWSLAGLVLAKVTTSQTPE